MTTPESSQGSEVDGDGSAGLFNNKNRRRSKHDPYDRSFMCGCGKTYLSYPALYTHIKNKHEGLQPQGTHVPENKKDKKRGRPRKMSAGDASGSCENIGSMQSLGYFGGPVNPLMGVETEEHGSDLYDAITRNIVGGDSAFTGFWNDVLAEYLVDISRFLRQDLYQAFVNFVQRLHHYLNEEGCKSSDAPRSNQGELSFCRSAKISAVQDMLTPFLAGQEDGKERSTDREISVHLQRWLYAHGYTDTLPEV